jgi:hypothetical protein
MSNRFFGLAAGLVSILFLGISVWAGDGPSAPGPAAQHSPPLKPSTGKADVKAAKPAVTRAAIPVVFKLAFGEAAIEKALASPTKMEFVDTPLADVVIALQDQHKIRICLDHKALADVGIEPRITVTRSIEGISLRSALDLLLRDLGLTWTIQSDVLLITTPDESQNNFTVRVYEVTDLVQCRDEKGQLWADTDSLIEMLASTIQPTTWDKVGGPGSIRQGTFAHATILAISQTRDVHHEIARVLKDLRTIAGIHPGDGKPPRRLRPKPVAEKPTGMEGGTERPGSRTEGMGGGMFAVIGAEPAEAARKNAGGVEASNDPRGEPSNVNSRPRIGQHAAVHAKSAGEEAPRKKSQQPASADPKPPAGLKLEFGEEAIRKALSSPAHVDFVDAPLVDVVASLRRQHKIWICIDHKALRDAEIRSDFQTTKSLEGISLRNALELLLRDIGLDWEIADEVLLITTREEANGRLIAKVYDVADLVECRDEKGEPWEDYETLAKMIRFCVQPTTWDEVGGPGSIVGGTFGTAKVLVVSQTRDVHEEVEFLLQQIREVVRKMPGDGKPPFRPRPERKEPIGLQGWSPALTTTGPSKPDNSSKSEPTSPAQPSPPPKKPAEPCKM